MTDTENREDCIYFARLSEQGERYEDMIKYMKIVSKVSKILTAVRPRALQRRAQPPLGGLQELSQDPQGRLAHHSGHPEQRRAQGQ